MSVTEHAVLSTFSRWFEVTFDNSDAAQYVVLFQHLPMTYDASSEMHSPSGATFWLACPCILLS